MKTLTLFIIAVVAFYSLHAQQGVGIGTDDVDESAILEIESSTKGLLIPRLTTTAMYTISSPSEGLLIYNMTAKAMFIYSNGTWSQLGTPKGSIVMWSGNIGSLPAGWALCDGRWYNPQDNSDRGVSASAYRTVKTPDLRARFIAGYDPEYDGANNAYDNPGNFSTGGTTDGDTGGESSVVLTTGQIPSHNHTSSTGGNHSHTISVSSGGDHDHVLRTSREYNRYPDLVNGPGVVFTGGGDSDIDNIDYETVSTKADIENDGSHTHTASASTHTGHTHTIGSTGGGAGHENRPPYYVLAFIIKL
ncbi:MAG: tail fiber protein [Reichenbachiella sp.]|uniref:tail fiber protein n=1 Tax=Reichenbachiella sp. TaxID=2184521 RepID=UPI00329A7C86